MNSRSKHLTRRLFASVAYVVALSTASARGDGSILFNGSTSQLVNAIANVFDGKSDQVTICVWVNAGAFAQGDTGQVIVFGADANAMVLVHADSADTLSWTSTTTGVTGVWTFTVADERWNAVAITHDRLNVSVNPPVRVNFADATVTRTSNEPGTDPREPSPGYGVGNYNTGTNGWEGKIAHVQVFNRILTPAEMDACLRKPGSVTNGLRLWLPMTHGTDIDDHSVNRFHATATDLATGASGPAIFTHPLGTPLGVVFLTPGMLPVDQVEIPRCADGTNHPAGELRGYGPASVIQGTVAGPTDGSNPQVIVKTQDYEQGGVKQWQSEGGPYPAVLLPLFADFTIVGRDYDASDYALPLGFHYNSTPIPSEPWHAPRTPTAVKGTSPTPGNEGATFNNADSIARSTNANLLDGKQEITVCFWARAANWGEDGYGRVILIGDSETATSTTFRIYHKLANSTLVIDKLPGSEMSDNAGRWEIQFADRHWNAVCVRLDFSKDFHDPTVRINKLPVTPIETSQPVGMGNAPTSTYTIGNNAGKTGTWDGQITHVQVWNRILSNAEADAAVDNPGSVGTGLRLYLPLKHATDTTDQSAFGFHVNVTPTNLLTHAGFNDREVGLGCVASGSRIKAIRHFNIAGPAGRIIRPTGSTGGLILPFDEEMVEIDDVSIYRCYSGYELNGADTQLGSYEAEYLRDWGLKFTAGGGYKIRGPVHVSGVYSGRPDSQSPAVWFTDDVGPSFGGPWYVENADIGMLLESSGAKLGPLYSHTCPHGNLRIMGERNTISNFQIEVVDGVTEVLGREAILIANQETTLRDGTFRSLEPEPGYPVPAGEIAIRMTNGARQTLDNLVFFGTGTSSVPMISVEAPLNHSTIVIKGVNSIDGGTLLDLYTPVGSTFTDRVGTGNYIWVQSNVTTPVDLAPGWTSTPLNPNVQTSNLIYINGVRYYPPGS